jgi:hypothetical protein
MKTRQEDAIILSLLFSGSDNDESVSANLQQSLADRDQSPTDEGKQERADFLVD